MEIQDYVDILNKRYKNGISKEHAYRGDLEALIRTIVPHVEVTNEPSQVTSCGNPDYVITRNQIPVGYIEAKDVCTDLHAKEFREQFSRYIAALDNLIITDYLTFRFYSHGNFVQEIRIADIVDGRIVLIREKVKFFAESLIDFCGFSGVTIKSPEKLADMMATKARFLQAILEQAILSDETSDENTTLRGQLDAFRQMLIQDITPKSFSDIYAQTIAYGLFAARLHDSESTSFSRQRAAELIPKSNPFLRKLFQYIAGFDIDRRILPTVENLAEVFRATDVKSLMLDFGLNSEKRDSVVHFYETFLSKYDKNLRKSRGVWYTPAPLVRFIIRAVDSLLRVTFNLERGLADNSKTTIKLESHDRDNRTKTGFRTYEKSVHKLQILDPATGTGTFLAEIIRYIHSKYFEKIQGAWEKYVQNDLIPRLNGFEILMASYAMAHLKLDLLFAEKGITANPDQRFRIFLTNSLEPHHPDTGNLFSTWLAQESNEANYIKRDTPVMIVVGNPPYNISGCNKGEWIRGLISDYKKDLKEKKVPLDDDYIKFIRYAQFLVERTGNGIVAYVTNNSFMDGITHRQMRKCLISAFDRIYILNLHGDTKKKETSPGESKDKNVFDIRQGVAIVIFVRTASRNLKKAKLNPEIKYFDLWGSRQIKYEFLDHKSIEDIPWTKLSPGAPNYFLVPKNFESKNEYDQGIPLDEVFKVKNSGVKTDRDLLFIDFEREILIEKIKILLSGDIPNTFQKKYRVENSGSYKILRAIKEKCYCERFVSRIMYKPFDVRWIYYDPTIISRPGQKVTKHLLGKDNIALIANRQFVGESFSHVFVTKHLASHGMLYLGNRGQDYAFPLFLYSANDERESNFSDSFLTNIESAIKKKIKPSCGGKSSHEITEWDLFDYIYAILHSSVYRKKYVEELKIGFPKIPLPVSAKWFDAMAVMGKELRILHLGEGKLDNNHVGFPISGSCRVGKIGKKSFENDASSGGKVWINEDQYFSGVDVATWTFKVGGYCTVQEWLKHRENTTLTTEDIENYIKMVNTIYATRLIINKIDKLYKEETGV